MDTELQDLHQEVQVKVQQFESDESHLENVDLVCFETTDYIEHHNVENQVVQVKVENDESHLENVELHCFETTDYIVHPNMETGSGNTHQLVTVKEETFENDISCHENVDYTHCFKTIDGSFQDLDNLHKNSDTELRDIKEEVEVHNERLECNDHYQICIFENTESPFQDKDNVDDEMLLGEINIKQEDQQKTEYQDRNYPEYEKYNSILRAINSTQDAHSIHRPNSNMHDDVPVPVLGDHNYCQYKHITIITENIDLNLEKNGIGVDIQNTNSELKLKNGSIENIGFNNGSHTRDTEISGTLSLPREETINTGTDPDTCTCKLTLCKQNFKSRNCLYKHIKDAHSIDRRNSNIHVPVPVLGDHNYCQYKHITIITENIDLNLEKNGIGVDIQNTNSELKLKNGSTNIEISDLEPENIGFNDESHAEISGTSTLTREETIDTGTDPDTCTFCKQNFKSRNCLSKHINDAHSIHRPNSSILVHGDHNYCQYKHITIKFENIDLNLEKSGIGADIQNTNSGLKLKKGSTNIEISDLEPENICFNDGSHTCDTEISGTSTLTREETIDTGTGPDTCTCTLCKQNFKSRNCLHKHIKVAHSIRRRNSSIPVHGDHNYCQYKGFNTVFQCNMCNKEFKTANPRRHMYWRRPRRTQLCNACHMISYSKAQVHQCNVCDKEFTSTHVLNQHMIRHHRALSQVHIYQCNVCQKGFQSVAGLEEHLTSHSKAQVHQCKVCDKEFKGLCCLKSHMLLVHSTERPHQCKVCDKIYKTIHALKGHMMSHSTDRRYQCKMCDEGYKTIHALKSHMMSHSTERPYQCKVCDKGYKTIHALKSHMISHSTERPHQCNLCDKGFKTITSLKGHLVRHRTDRPHQCTVCDKGFATAHALKSHMISHSTERLHQCNLCDKGFKTINGLKCHMIRHSTEQPHQCNLCDKGFKTINDLRIHLISHGTDRPHQCTVCDKRFKVLSALKGHMKCHSSERPNLCNLCGKGFKAANDLKQHMYVHSSPSEWPHLCSVCGKQFKLAYLLKSHMLTHSDERPFQCKVCSKRFKTDSYLKIHLLPYMSTCQQKMSITLQ